MDNSKAKQPGKGTQQARHGQFVSQSLFVCTCNCSPEEREQEQHADHFELSQPQSQSQSQVHGKPLPQTFSVPKEQQGSGHKDKSHDAKN